ncbi:MAG: hypothetical protein HYW22_00345 [Candidatus Aenigmarchaeota archaeon]|nr:hypothetical protein [Candidatus Aenigmarchaeota archaeon]
MSSAVTERDYSVDILQMARYFPDIEQRRVPYGNRVFRDDRDILKTSFPVPSYSPEQALLKALIMLGYTEDGERRRAYSSITHLMRDIKDVVKEPVDQIQMRLIH